MTTPLPSANAMEIATAGTFHHEECRALGPRLSNGSRAKCDCSVPDERERLALAIDAAIDAAVREEREACARLIEKLYRTESKAVQDEDETWNRDMVRSRVRQRDAAAIRARSAAPQQEAKDE